MIVTGNLDLRHLDGENRLLLAPLEVEWRGHKFVVAEDFVTDLASIPRGLRWLVPKGRNESKGAVVHDWIYRGHCTKLGITREEADEMMLDIMNECGVNYPRRYLIYNGVRVGGHWSFKG